MPLQEKGEIPSPILLRWRRGIMRHLKPNHCCLGLITLTIRPSERVCIHMRCHPTSRMWIFFFFWSYPAFCPAPRRIWPRNPLSNNILNIYSIHSEVQVYVSPTAWPYTISWAAVGVWASARAAPWFEYYFRWKELCENTFISPMLWPRVSSWISNSLLMISTAENPWPLITFNLRKGKK